jgi:hypothetical protein
MRHTSLVVLTVAAALAVPAASRADTELDRLCAIAIENVGDCPCATDFLSSHLSPENAKAVMESWGMGSSDPRHLTGAALYRKYGRKADQIVAGFFAQLNDFRAACPAVALRFDDADLVKPHAVPLMSKTCAYRDLDATIAIDDHIAAEDVVPEQLYRAHENQIVARDLCRAGRVAESMAMYDRIMSMGSAVSRRAD